MVARLFVGLLVIQSLLLFFDPLALGAFEEVVGEANAVVTAEAALTHQGTPAFDRAVAVNKPTQSLLMLVA